MENKIKAYINAACGISPLSSFPDDSALFHGELPSPHSNHLQQLNAVEPDYKTYITEAGRRRRMARLTKMGVTVATECLKISSQDSTDAIVTATAMGCLEDSWKFLRNMIDNNEAMLNPAPFVQSTGNTFGGQTGMVLHNHCYNMTYCHGGFSTETALIDAMLQMADGDINSALVVAGDEITPTEYEAMEKMGFWRSGRMMGEGMHAFLLQNEKKENGLAAISDVETKQGPLKACDINMAVDNILSRNQLSVSDIDLVLTGTDCDLACNAAVNQKFEDRAFDYKSLCGQYATASAYALWLESCILRKQLKPQNGVWDKATLKNILIYSEYRANDYSFILIQAQ